MSNETALVKIPSNGVHLALPTDTKDAVAEKIILIERLAEWIKEARKLFDESLFEYIEQHGSVQAGELVYFIGPTKKPPKCQDVPAAVEAVLRAVEGDFERFCDHLSSGALKYGACRTTIGDEQFLKLWRIEEPVELQCEMPAKAERKLQKFNPAFVAGR